MMSNAVNGRIVKGALFSLLVLWAAPTWANHIDTCDHACRLNCEVSGHTETNCQQAIGGFCIVENGITCTSADPGSGRYDGMDLVFKSGAKLNCTTNDCGSAVTIKGSPSTISTELATGTALGGTSGGFNWTINCGGYNDSVVERLEVTGGNIGIINCEIVNENIVDGYDRNFLTVNRGIAWTRKVNSGSGPDKATDNLISDKVWSITAEGNGTKVLVDGNHIMTSNKSAIVFRKDVWAVWNAVKNNIIHGSGDSAYSNFFYGVDPVIFSGPTTGASTTNDCSVDDHPGCAACISAGACLDYIPQ